MNQADFETSEPITSIEMRRGELLKELTDMGYDTIPLRRSQVEELIESVRLAHLEKAS